MTIRDFIGLLAYLTYAITVIAVATWLAPPCTGVSTIDGRPLCIFSTPEGKSPWH